MADNARQSVSFDGHQVDIEWPDDALHQAEVPALVDFLFGDMPKTANCKLESRFSVHHDEDTEQWMLTRDGADLFAGPELNGLGNVLGGEALFSLIENNNRGMAIHAGLVSSPSGSILLPADSGSGKSSVTTWLIKQGWHYHTDELVIINLDSGELSAFMRPLNIKTHGIAPVSELLEMDFTNERMRPCQMVTMIPHRLINPSVATTIPPLSAIVFPGYSRDMTPRLQALGGAEAGLELMRSNVIARNLPGHGFAGITRLVRNLPAYRLSYQHFDQLESLLAPLTPPSQATSEK